MMQNQRSKKALLHINMPLSQRQPIQTYRNKVGDNQSTHQKGVFCRFCAHTDQPLYHIKIQLQKFAETKTLKTNLNLSLTMKYSQSQTYYYTKPINEFLHNLRCTQVIQLKEIISFSGVDGNEWLRRLYAQHEIPNKLTLLSQYYRFHNEIPRMFMIPESDVMNNYHDKKRRIEYFRISKEIENENRNNPNKPPKGIVGDRPEAKQDSQDVTPQSSQAAEKVYGNFLLDITPLGLERTNVSFTMQEINQRLDEVINRVQFKGLEKQLEIELQIKSTKFEDDHRIKEFFSTIGDKDLKPSLKAKIKKDLRLDEDVLRAIYSNNNYITPLNYQKLSSQSPLTKKQSAKITIKQPQSARNNVPMQQMMTTSKTTMSKGAISQPFFMSQALQIKLQLQQNIIQQNSNKKTFSISPRSGVQKPTTQLLQSAKNSAQKSQATQQTQIQSYRSLLGQGQGSQEAYQVPNEPKLLSSKNYIPLKQQQYFPKQVSNQTNYSKNTSKISANVITAESSPIYKPTKVAQVVGSQTQRVTSQKDIQQLLRLQKQQSIYESISKDALNKILGPAKTPKQINDFVMIQLQVIKQSQSSSLVKNQMTSKPQMVRRSQIKSKQRQSMNFVDIKLPATAVVQHQHAKSDINQVVITPAQQDMQKLTQVLNEGNKRMSKIK